MEIALDSLAPPAPPTEQDAVKYGYEFYPLEVVGKDNSRMRELVILHEVISDSVFDFFKKLM